MRILHLEDDPRDADLVRMLLSTEGMVCEVRRAERREEFVAALDEGGVDLILSDFALPSFDGGQALDIANERCPDVPFVFFSGTIGEDAAIDALRGGATDYVLKDRPGRLVPALRRALREARERAQRRQAEERLRAAEETYRVVAETASDGIVTIDDEGRITFVNPAAEQIFGYSADELWGVELAMLMPERFREVHRAGLRLFLATGQRGVSWTAAEFAGLHKDGHEIPLEISFGVLRRGGTYLFTGIIRDITERKRAEQKVHDLNESLERRVLERTAELEATTKELEAFSYSVSHDLRAPLRAINGFAQIVLEEYGETVDERCRDYLERVNSGCARMAELIEALLALARVARWEMRRETVDCSALAEAVAADLRTTNTGRQVLFTAAEGLIVDADRALVRAVLENLLGNAWKYTSKHPTARIDFGAIKRRGEQVFFVRDDGAGFDMAYASKLYGAFQRLHGSDEFEGTGIGLATVQRIVHRHGGRTWAESSIEQGATFYFTLAPECRRQTA